MARTLEGAEPIMSSRRRFGVLVALTLAIGLNLAGCTSPAGPQHPSGDRPTAQRVKGEASSDRKATKKKSKKKSSSAPVWTCYYDPTMNRDWHDDVLCENGLEQDRPYLRPKDKFVTEAEIMRSAREYEKKLNRRS